MEKIPPVRFPGPADIATTVTKLRRWTRHLDRPPVERMIIEHILWEGRDLRWTLYTGINLLAVLGRLFDRDLSRVSRALTSLQEQGWIMRGTNDDGQRYIQLTKKFTKACALARQRFEVQRALGSMWGEINGNDEVLDKLHKRSLEMGHVKYRDRVRAVGRMYIDDMKSRKIAFAPSANGVCAQRKSNLRPAQLRLIKGERKYGT